MKKYYSFDNVKLCYEFTAPPGSTECVVLINGHTRSQTDFKFFSKKMAEHGFQVLTLDNRGSGETFSEGVFTIDDMAEDVSKLLQHLGIKSFHIVGNSMGGMIALTLAIRNSCQLMSLTLMSTTYDRLPLKKNDAGWGADPEKTRIRLEKYFSTNFLKKNQLLFQAMLKQMTKNMQVTQNIVNANAQIEALRNFVLDIKDLNKLRISTLILHGEVDQIVPLNQAFQLQRAIKNSQVEVCPDAGHLLLAEAPKWLLDTTLRFISRAPSV